MTTSTLNTNGSTVTLGDYQIANNEWGVQYVPGQAQLSYVSISYGSQGATGGITINNAYPSYQPSAGVWGFSEVLWGGTYNAVNQTLNTSINNLKSMIVNFSTTLAGTNDQHADELLQFYVKDASGKVVNDVSVQTAGWMPTSGNVTWQSGFTNKAYSDSHITANLLLGTVNDADGIVPMEVFRTTTDQFSGTVDIATLLQYLVKNGIVNANDYISGVELGSETISGSSVFTVNQFNVFESLNSTKTITDTGSQANQYFTITTNNNYVIDGTSKYAGGDVVQVSSSGLGFSVSTSSDGHLHLAGNGFGSIDINNIGTVQFNDGSYAVATNTLTVNLTASNVVSNLSAIESAVGVEHVIVNLTDSGIPTVSITAAQLSADTAALKAIAGTYNLAVTAAPGTITGIGGGAATIVEFADSASHYTITTNADHSMTVTEGSTVYHLSNVTELQFSDMTDVVASSAPATGATVSSAQITEIYGAVFGRTPDSGGLAYYENIAQTNPTLSLVTYTEFFLSSPEYTGNSAHAYTLDAAGQTKFITGLYENLLGRAPAAGDAAWYEANVMNPIITADVASGSTLAQATPHAQAQTVVYFSQSQEFTNDVSTTGTGTPAFGGHHWLQLV